MRLIENKVTERLQEPGVEGMYKFIQLNAAVCYQSDIEKMKLSPKEFVENVLVKNAHGRPLEFGSVYLALTNDEYMKYNMYKYMDNKYSVCNYVIEDNMWYITTNFRVIMQGDYSVDEEAAKNGYDKNWIFDLAFWCEPTANHSKRRTFVMDMSRGCVDDFRTHITLSSLCESTRFCGYNKNKFKNELTFIKPYWISDSVIEAFNKHDYSQFINNGEIDSEKWAELKFLESMEKEEKEYLEMGKFNLQPQQLKRLFPLGAKAELALCGFDKDWKNFFWRRTDSHADPECVKVAKMIKEKF